MKIFKTQKSRSKSKTKVKIDDDTVPDKKSGKNKEYVKDVDHSGDKFTFHGARNRLVKKISPSRCYLIDMQLRNGMNSDFIVSTKNDHFVYEGGLYILPKSPEMSSYNLQSKLNKIRYHQDFPIPVSILFRVDDDKRKKALLTPEELKNLIEDYTEKGFDSLELIKAVEGTGITSLETAFNPKSLQLFVKSTVIQNVLRGQQMAEWFTRAMIMLIVITATCIIHLLIYLQQSGALNNII